MENLIFNGTATRKPLNLAEISLYIENNKQILPSEYTEVRITRRLYRSGDSEYLINNQPVRLMDIQNMFADTGMGADAYSVIELKMVEQILSENPHERRRLFEEAAGIKKYKARRRSAFNKLDTTEQELTRLDDLISEVQRSVNSLARQVGKARRYHALKDELKEKEIVLAHLRINAYEQELNPLKIELEQVKQSRDGLNNEVRVMEADVEKMQSDFLNIEQEYRSQAAQLHEKEEAVQELRNDINLKKQRQESLNEQLASDKIEIEQQEQRRTELMDQLSLLEKHRSENKSEMDAAQLRYRESANQQEEQEEQLNELRTQYQSFVQNNLQNIDKSGTARQTIQRLEVESEGFQNRLNKISEAQIDLGNEQKGRQDKMDEADHETAAAGRRCQALRKRTVASK